MTHVLASPSLAMDSQAHSDLARLRELLAVSGLQVGLAFLNKRVPHRFTAVYRLQDANMDNCGIVDKQGAAIPQALVRVHFENSFCQFVLRDGGFVTSQSGDDVRLAGHPYQGVLLSYVGLPLSGDDGELIGTLCHFDFDAREVQDAEYAFLQQAASCIAPYL